VSLEQRFLAPLADPRKQDLPRIPLPLRSVHQSDGSRPAVTRLDMGTTSPRFVPHVDLARSRDLLLRVSQHLFPLGKPTYRARDGKKNGEHLRLEAQSLVDDPRIKVHVGIELALYKVFVLQSDPLQFQRNLNLGIPPRDLKNLIGSPFDDFGTRVVVLVDAVPEPHESSASSFNAFNIGRNFVLGPNLIQHLQHFFIGATVQRSGKGGSGGGNADKWIRQGTTHGAHDVGTAILFVIGVKNKENIQGLG
jgi:hypothetical protein